MDSCVQPREKARLILLTPDCLAGDRNLAQKISWMGLHSGLDVMYLVLMEDFENRLTVYRNLATMEAISSTTGLNVSSKVIETTGWLTSLREIARPGNVIVCHIEQSIRTGFFQVDALNSYLETHLSMPVRTVTGFYHPQPIQIKHFLHELLYWAGFLLILGLFSWMEISIDHMIQGGQQIILLCFILCLEFGAILTWHDLLIKKR